MQEQARIESESPSVRPRRAKGPKRLLRLALYGVVGLALAAAIVPRTPWYQERERAEVRGILQQWCQLETFPAARSADTMLVQGGTMTRGFEYDFVIAPAAMPAWIEASSGLRQAVRERDGQIETFAIKPVEAQFCQVQFDHGSGKVHIRAAWS